MADKQQTVPAGFVRKETLWTAVMVALAAGFLIGVLFTVFKSSRQSPMPPAGTGMPRQPAPGQISEADASRLFDLEQKVKTNPADAASWAQIGNLYFDSGNFDKAIEAYETSLKYKPDNPNVLTDLGVMYRRRGNPRKAVEKFDAAIAIDPTHQVSRFNKGIVLIHDLKDLEGGIASWEALLAINPLAMAPNGQSVDELIQQFRAMTKNSPPGAAGAKK